MTPFHLKSLNKKLGAIDLNDPDFNYSLQPFVQKWIHDHPPSLSYSSKPLDKPFGKWKSEVHALVKDKVKIINPLPLSEQKLQIHGEAEANNIRFIKFSLECLPGLRVPAVLCVPESNNEILPVVICIHGHSMSKENSIGIRKSKSKEYFGYELARQGVITLSLDWIGAGERQKFKNKIPILLQNEGERSNWVRFLGLDMLGLRITEVKGLLNYLETRDEVDSNRIGIVGHSGGGALSLFTTILDERIKVCGGSGYFGTWKHSLLAMYHCGCNYSADLGKHLEMYDLFASLAPLPVVASIGKKDRIYPIEGTNEAIPFIKKAYSEAECLENVLIDVQPKGHQFYGENVYPFILKHLKML